MRAGDEIHSYSVCGGCGHYKKQWEVVWEGVIKNINGVWRRLVYKIEVGLGGGGECLILGLFS